MLSFHKLKHSDWVILNKNKNKHDEWILPGSPFSPFKPSLPSRPGNPGIPGKPGNPPEGQVSVETRERQRKPTKRLPKIMWQPNMFAVERGDNRTHTTWNSELCTHIHKNKQTKWQSQFLFCAARVALIHGSFTKLHSNKP